MGEKLSSFVAIIWSSIWLICLSKKALGKEVYSTIIHLYIKWVFHKNYRLLWIRMNNIYNALYSVLNRNLKHSFLNSLSSILPPGGTTSSWVNIPSFHTWKNTLKCLCSILVAHPPPHLHTLIFQKYIWIKKMVIFFPLFIW